MYSNGFLNMMIYTHTINTAPESNYENDDDVIVFLTFFILLTVANVVDKLLLTNFNYNF